MNENLYETQKNVTPKSKIKIFYEKNKISIFTSISVLFLFFISLNFYIEGKKNKAISLSENYVDAKIYLKNNDRNIAKKILKEIVLANNNTYSSLSLFMLLDEGLLEDKKEIVDLFDHVLNNNKFEKEMENLIILKRSLYYLSNLENEEKLLNSIKPLLKDESVWKAHALILMGDYYFSKKSFFKAKEFYNEIMNLKNIDASFYNKASNQLRLID
tara:strand:- start:260 stop:904 length:645 start_codon:yes stop_codon:yes gene_type:complete